MRIMSVDLGMARTGVALCDPAETLASPLCVIHERREDQLLEELANLFQTLPPAASSCTSNQGGNKH